jgi:hypothetical protein
MGFSAVAEQMRDETEKSLHQFLADNNGDASKLSVSIMDDTAAIIVSKVKYTIDGEKLVSCVGGGTRSPNHDEAAFYQYLDTCLCGARDEKVATEWVETNTREVSKSVKTFLDGDKKLIFKTYDTAHFSKRCDGCSGTGIVTCHTCSGLCQVRCGSCHGDGSVTCNYCHGNGQVTCTVCSGRGSVQRQGNSPDTCGACYGHGQRRCSNCGGVGKKGCTTCNGNGKVTCSTCGGAGRISHSACNGSGYYNYTGVVNAFLNKGELRYDCTPQGNGYEKYDKLMAEHILKSYKSQNSFSAVPGIVLKNKSHDASGYEFEFECAAQYIILQIQYDGREQIQIVSPNFSDPVYKFSVFETIFAAAIKQANVKINKSNAMSVYKILSGYGFIRESYADILNFNSEGHRSDEKKIKEILRTYRFNSIISASVATADLRKIAEAVTRSSRYIAPSRKLHMPLLGMGLSALAGIYMSILVILYTLQNTLPSLEDIYIYRETMGGLMVLIAALLIYPIIAILDYLHLRSSQKILKDFKESKFKVKASIRLTTLIYVGLIAYYGFFSLMRYFPYAFGTKIHGIHDQGIRLFHVVTVNPFGINNILYRLTGPNHGIMTYLMNSQHEGWYIVLFLSILIPALSLVDSDDDGWQVSLLFSSMLVAFCFVIFGLLTWFSPAEYYFLMVPIILVIAIIAKIVRKIKVNKESRELDDLIYHEKSDRAED